jgi:ribosomal protein S18 acetylase RimI-like enzyme
MKLVELNQADLNRYKAIEMIKNVYEIRTYKTLKTFDTTSVKPYTIDMNIEESLDEWIRFINFNKSKILAIEDQGLLVAGAIIITDSEAINMLKIIPNSACLWDIRVSQKYQGKGLGKMLFDACIQFSKDRQKSAIMIETQHNNPSAIKFYEACGATLYQVNKNHYPGLDEDQLLFVYTLGGQDEV